MRPIEAGITIVGSRRMTTCRYDPHCRRRRRAIRTNHCRVVHESPARATRLRRRYRPRAAPPRPPRSTAPSRSPTSARSRARSMPPSWRRRPPSTRKSPRALLEAGIDVLVEKPIAPDLAAAARLIEIAERRGRILQVGHLERFNPAVIELERRAHLPLFFEIHRLNLFSPRSLDVDVVLDLMIHDVDIVLALTRRRARGNPGRGRPHPLAKGGYRQRAAAVPERLHRQPDRQPGLHRAGPQAPPVPAAAVPFARLHAGRIWRFSRSARTGRSASSRRR